MKKTWIIVPIGIIIVGIISLEAYGYVTPMKYRSISRWNPYIEKFARMYGIDPRFVAATMYQESRGNPYAISETGAIGLMQIMPATAKGICNYSIKDLYNPIKNIQCGTKYLAEMYQRFKDYRWVASGYYGGPGTSPRSTKGTPPVKKYVVDVMTHYNILKSKSKGITV